MSGRLTIDLDTLAANFHALDSASGGGSGAVVKADAYGLGMSRVATRLWQEGCRRFFVATAAEGETLRKVLANATIYVFEGVSEETVAMVRDARLVPVLNHDLQLACWRAGASGLPAAIHVDTGMNRLGFSPDVQAEIFSDVRIELLLTHLACADDPAHPRNRAQLECFAAVRARFPGVPASIGNSAAVLLGAGEAGDFGRPGIALYGGNPFSDRPNPMQTVVTLEGRILQLRDIAAGDAVGYGASFRAKRPMSLAITGVGYADGIPRLLSNRGEAFVAGVRRPIVGRVSMELTVVDVTGLPVEVGDWVEFIGPHILLEEVAQWASTIGYEILTGLGTRLSRVYCD